MLNILILEDETTSRMLLRQLLSQYGNVYDYENGRDVLNKYKESLEKKEYFDLVCLDIMVPEMDGQEVLHEIRKAEESYGLDRLKYQTKILMITALDDKDNFLYSFKEQCDGYIIKPFDRSKIDSALKKLNLI